MPPPDVRIAFKEWASIVRALELAHQDIIFRKGGIAEENRGFEVTHAAFLLFPTYFHQQLTGIRPEHASLLSDAMAARPPAGRIVITSWAEVIRTWPITTEAELAALEPRHVYRAAVLQDRLHGRYGRTLFAIEVRTHRLPAPLDLPDLPAYAGCRSWVDLDAAPDASSG
jgi:hypothetical protein